MFSVIHMHPGLRRRKRGSLALGAWVWGLLLAVGQPLVASPMGLEVTPRAMACPHEASTAPALQALPEQAAHRIPDSQVTAGRHDVAWAWLGSPTLRYPHRALGSPTHAASIHALVRSRSGAWRLVESRLPLHRVYEDRVPRILDIDRDGSEEIILVEADALRGASLVVLGIYHAADRPVLVERARSAFAGTSFRWLNPVGVADFDADGQLDVAMVLTPHIGGELQLLHYRPPSLVPYARALDVSNHRMGAIEQGLAVIAHTAGHRPTVVVPDMTQRALHALRWDAPGRWTELGDVVPLPGRIERLTPAPGGACATLDDGRSLLVVLPR
jgi:hypothetical protein